eukprot:UN30366
MLLRISGTVLHQITFEQINLECCMLVTGFFICNICFIFAAEQLFNLTLCITNKTRILKKDSVAFSLLTTRLFIWTPSSVFMSSTYTEPICCLLSFTLMYLIELKKNLLSSVILFLACCLRSNSVIMLGFPLYKTFYEIIKNQKKKTRNWIALISSLCLHIVLALLPIVLYDMYVRDLFCDATTTSTGFHCQDKIFPTFYNYVQKEYWDLGLFRFYEYKNVPCFLLASPIWLLTICGIYTYGNYDWSRFLSIGIYSQTNKRRKKSHLYQSHNDR